MSSSFSQDITITSVILSASALGIIVVLYIVLMRRLRELQGVNTVDVVALVQEFSERQKRLEERIIDEKVRREVLELRLSKAGLGVQSSQVVRARIEHPVSFEERKIARMKREEPDTSLEDLGGVRVEAGVVAEESVVRRDATTIEILEAVMQGGNGKTSKQIQERIGRSREHTARMMKLLYKEGLVSRDVNARPFTYSLTEAGHSLLGR